MCLEIRTLGAMAALDLAARPIPAASITALVVTDTDDRSSAWAVAFAERMGLKYVGWTWDRKLKAWDLVLSQTGHGTAKPMAEVHMYFADSRFGYVLSLLEYRPLFWMGQHVKFGPEVSRRHPVQEAVFENDNGREIAAVVRKLSFACKDDIDPVDRVVRLLNEIGRNYSFKFLAVKKDSIEIEAEGNWQDLHDSYLKKLDVFGFQTKLFAGSSPTARKLVIEVPQLKKGK